MNTLLEQVMMLNDIEWSELQEQRRFWSRVDMTGGPDSCWKWLGCDNGNGYGVARYHGKTIHSHRLSYILTTGEKLDTMTVVRHKCDNRICCNPNHLESGSHADNIRDWQTRLIDQKGEHNFASKLTEDKVKEIRRLVHNDVSQKDVADFFGISTGAISMIVQGKSWTHSFDPDLLPNRNHWSRRGGNPRKFSTVEVVEMRKKFDDRKRTISDLVKEYGATRGTITRIVKRMIYRDIP